LTGYNVVDDSTFWVCWCRCKVLVDFEQLVSISERVKTSGICIATISLKSQKSSAAR
jgi:hypothetical protein